MLSPFPWIINEVWTSWNKSNPTAADIYDGSSPIRDFVLTVVSVNDVRRAPIMPVPPDVLVPPQGTLLEHEKLLNGTTGGGYIGMVRWPICDERLTTLLMESGSGIHLADIESQTGPLDQALLEVYTIDTTDTQDIVYRDWANKLQQMRLRKYGGDGINIFHCRTCGRIYGAYSEP